VRGTATGSGPRYRKTIALRSLANSGFVYGETVSWCRDGKDEPIPSLGPSLTPGYIHPLGVGQGRICLNWEKIKASSSDNILSGESG
jgi:hypothetical protein